MIVTRDFAVETGWALREYDGEGELLQRIAIPYPEGFHPQNDVPGAVHVLADGRVAVYNGNRNAYLSVYDPATDLWTHATHPDWSTGNGSAFSGLTSFGHFVFASDVETGQGDPSGIVRFDVAGGGSLRFGDQQSRDVTLGQDGLLYSVRLPGYSAYILDVYAPDSLELIRTVTLAVTVETENIMGVAVDPDGHIFALSLSQGWISHYGPDGALLDELVLGTHSVDIEIGTGGRLVVGSFDGRVFITDTAFSQVTSFLAGANNVRLALVPEAGVSWLVALGWLAARRAGRRPTPGTSRRSPGTPGPSRSR